MINLKELKRALSIVKATCDTKSNVECYGQISFGGNRVETYNGECGTSVFLYTGIKEPFTVDGKQFFTLINRFCVDEFEFTLSSQELTVSGDGMTLRIPRRDKFFPSCFVGADATEYTPTSKKLVQNLRTLAKLIPPDKGTLFDGVGFSETNLYVSDGKFVARANVGAAVHPCSISALAAAQICSLDAEIVGIAWNKHILQFDFDDGTVISTRVRDPIHTHPFPALDRCLDGTKEIQIIPNKEFVTAVLRVGGMLGADGIVEFHYVNDEKKECLLIGTAEDSDVVTRVQIDSTVPFNFYMSSKRLLQIFKNLPVTALVLDDICWGKVQDLTFLGEEFELVVSVG